MLLLIVGAILGIVIVLGIAYKYDREGFYEATNGQFAWATGAGAFCGFVLLGLLPSIFISYDEYTMTTVTYPVKSVQVNTDRWTGTKGRTYSEDNLKLYYKTGGTWRPHTIPFDEMYLKLIESNEPPTVTVIKEVPADNFYNNWIVLDGTKEKYRYIIKGALQ